MLAAVAELFAQHDVSIQTVRQEGRGDDAQLVVVTHTAPDAALSATVDGLRSMAIVRGVTSVMRVEGGPRMTTTPAGRGHRGCTSGAA